MINGNLPLPGLPTRDLIATEASKAYDVLAEQPGMMTSNMHARPYCNQFTWAAIPIIRSGLEGLDTSVRAREWRPSGVKDFLATSGMFFHKFISVENQGESLLVDGTWQQFLSKRRRHERLPRVLVGQVDEVIEFASNYGVPERFLRVWRGSS